MLIGIVVEPEKLYSQQVPLSFKITMASLGPDSLTKTDGTAANGTGRSTVMLVHQKDGEFALCSLTPGRVEQQPLDIVLRQGDEIHLRVEGSSTVHLVGYYVDLPDENGDSEGDEETDYSAGESINSENMLSEEDVSEMDEYDTEDSDEDSQAESDSEMEAKSRRAPKPKVRLIQSDDDEDEDDSEDDSEYDSEDDSESGESGSDIGTSEDEEIDSDEFETDDIDSELSGEEENSDGSEEQSSEEELASKKHARKDLPAAMPEAKKPKLVTPQATPKALKTAPAGVQSSTHVTPKVVSELKKVDTPKSASKVVETPKATPKTEKATPKTDKATTTPTPKTEKATEAKKENVKPASTTPTTAQQELLSKTLPNGVSIQDLSLGTGIKAQKGRTVHLTVHLSTPEGKPLGKQAMSFTCGAGKEDASGLDAGVVGMALGGERKMVIPAGLMKEKGEVVATVKLDKVINTK